MDLEFLGKLNREMTEKFPLLRPITLDIKIDGSVNRLDSLKEDDKAIWLCIHSWNYKSNTYYKAIYGNWRIGHQHETKSWENTDGFSKAVEFKEQEKTSAIEAKNKLEKEQQEKYQKCRDYWGPIYYRCPETSPTFHYLKNKKISSNFHARVTHQGTLLVPAWNANGLFVGAQRIILNPEDNRYEKKFTYGIEKKGSFCPFGDIRHAKFVYIAEGFATAASIYMAFKNDESVAVIAAWDTGNLLPAAQSVRQINPNSYLIFAADKDIHPDPKHNNVGERKAKYAAGRLSNAIVKTVKFNISNDGWSDYNDLHQFEGLDQVLKQLYVDSTDFVEIIPLGFDDSKYYYFSTARNSIIVLSKSDHNPTNLTMNAPEKYWGDRYGYVVKQDGTKTSNPNWRRVIEGLGTQITEKGRFDYGDVRGMGAWQHEKGLIVNTGDRLYFKNEFYSLFNNSIKTKYFYQAGKAVKLDFSRPAGNSDTLKIVEAFQMLQYKNPSDYIIALGWIFSAQIFAALPWRPHIWFTGPRGSGKSTILSYVASMVDFSIMVQGSTAAGIRQELKNNAIPIIYDESEPDSKGAYDRMAEILEMARQSSTRSSYKILRGSASGNSTSYNTNTTFCMGSIQISQMNSADISRFFIIEMKSTNDQSHEDFIRLENAMYEAQGLSTGLFVRAVNMYETHIENIEITKRTIKSKKVESRQADQLAPIIAGYWAYFSTEKIDENFIMSTLNEMNFRNSEYAKANEEDESEKCLETIMSVQIPSKNWTISQVIYRYKSETNQFMIKELDDMLGTLGILYNINAGELFISSNNPMLKSLMERFSSYSDYKNILKRHANFVREEKASVSGRKINGIVLKA